MNGRREIEEVKRTEKEEKRIDTKNKGKMDRKNGKEKGKIQKVNWKEPS